MSVAKTSRFYPKDYRMRRKRRGVIWVNPPQATMMKISDPIMLVMRLRYSLKIGILEEKHGQDSIFGQEVWGS